MRFAIATADKFDGVFGAFMTAGWQPLKLFTFSLEGRFQGNAVSAEAQKMGLPVQVSRLSEADLAALADGGCEALIVANYRWRIGDWQKHMRYGVNFHPSPLPEGRGPWPLVQAIREGRRAWGVSCHRLTPEFDGGEILAQELFPMDENESHETLDLRCQMGMRRLGTRVAKDFVDLWKKAQPQDESKATYWKRGTTQDRLLDMKGSVDQARRQINAFGMLECTAVVAGSIVFIRRAVAWREAHGVAAGTLVHRNDRSLVFALKDGYLGLLDWSLVPTDFEPRTGR